MIKTLKASMSSIASPIGNCSSCNETKEEGTICRHIGKEAIKLTLFADGMVANIDNPKESAK